MENCETDSRYKAGEILPLFLLFFIGVKYQIGIKKSLKSKIRASLFRRFRNILGIEKNFED